ncbi:hypothetical protein [Fluviispira multicolorata]|uniref:NlpC/P60 family protein n=1 Tax=Fluviispira multicolorata TaxID=2654512 RepID=A0A833JAS0_9BACT|nr:hypothetical protein [Fluviispira multicolorata]KAB8027393.1 hypothetical protein GCL57_14450 [Fluviispira multicolorata]
MNFLRFLVLVVFCSLNFHACSAPSKAPFPLGTEIEWEELLKQNNSSIAKDFIHSSKIIHDRLLYKGIPYEKDGISQFWENRYQASQDKFKFMRKYGVDCTRLLRYLFRNMLQLPYNSLFTEAPIISHTFANINSQNAKQLRNFIRVPQSKNGFRPQTGDILAFPGHAIAVLDPKNCISIQSSSWVCKNIKDGRCVEAEMGKYAGVAIYKLASNRFCSNGLWKGMDGDHNKFTVAWRHRAFTTWISEMPKHAFTSKRIFLTGKNIAGKYIYFEGSNKAVRTTLNKYNKKNGLQSVFVLVPNDAKSGKIKIYWGTGRPTLLKTVDSSLSIIINKKGLVRNK